jgi:hypothetical protein
VSLDSGYEFGAVESIGHSPMPLGEMENKYNKSCTPVYIPDSPISADVFRFLVYEGLTVAMSDSFSPELCNLVSTPPRGSFLDVEAFGNYKNNMLALFIVMLILTVLFFVLFVILVGLSAKKQCCCVR